jgi:hypothetical protein
MMYRAGRTVIKSALQDAAEPYLRDLLTDISRELAWWPWRQVRLRYMRSRWGSCSGRNDITLNTQLLRVERELQRYVLIHELGHTTQHNHSSAFWQAVAAIEPDYALWRKRLKNYTLWV